MAFVVVLRSGNTFVMLFARSEKWGGILGRRGVRTVPGTGDVLLSRDRVVGFLDAPASGGG